MSTPNTTKIRIVSAAEQRIQEQDYAIKLCDDWNRRRLREAVELELERWEWDRQRRGLARETSEGVSRKWINLWRLVRSSIWDVPRPSRAEMDQRAKILGLWWLELELRFALHDADPATRSDILAALTAAGGDSDRIREVFRGVFAAFEIDIDELNYPADALEFLAARMQGRSSPQPRD